MQANKQTYILFEKENDKILEISSPVFEDEISTTKAEQFFNNESVENLQESIFRLLYFSDYKKNFDEFWYEFIETFLISIDFNLDSYYDEEKDTIYNELVMISRDEKDKSIFYIHFSIDNDPIIVFHVTKKLLEYAEDLFDVEIGESFYYDDSTQMMYFAENAYFYKNKNKITLN